MSGVVFEGEILHSVAYRRVVVNLRAITRDSHLCPMGALSVTVTFISAAHTLRLGGKTRKLGMNVQWHSVCSTVV
jgi:hypothetical protein